MIASTDHNLLGHPSAQHDLGALDHNHERAGMVVADDGDFDIGHEPHRDQPAVQAASGFNCGQPDFFAGPHRRQRLYVFALHVLLRHLSVLSRSLLLLFAEFLEMLGEIVAVLAAVGHKFDERHQPGNNSRPKRVFGPAGRLLGKVRFYP